MTDQSQRDIPSGASEPTSRGAARVIEPERSAATRATPSILSSEWDYRPANELVDALRARKVSASELVEHAIARIEAFDLGINAVVVRDFVRARTAASAADAALAKGERQPLLGVPITIKEALNIAGLPTTWGFPQFKDFIPEEDAVIVSRLKSAGAIILGKTNLPVGLGDFQSYNEVYGTTNNPWDYSRSPGGSSGGSAAALAAGFGALSFGSDIGGSLRVPAHFCGVYAHKPTFGLVPFRGYELPQSPVLPRNGDLAVIGPMARSASDLSLALDVIAGPDKMRDGIAYGLALPPARHTNLKDFRVLVVDFHPLMPVSDVVRMAMNRLSERLAKAGAQVACSNALLPDLSQSARLYMWLLAAVKAAGSPRAHYEEIQRLAATLSPQDTGLQSQRTRGTVATHRDWLAADLVRSELQQQWHHLFLDWDVVLYPPASIPAFCHDHSLPIEARHIEIDGKARPYLDACFIWADPATTCGLPVTAVPIEVSPDGLPIGVQIIGPYLEDRTTIAFAELLEKKFGGFVAPPGLGNSL
jgi:amidase